MASPRNEISRIIIEMPKEQHKRLKMRAAMLGKSMKDIILESLEATEECLNSDHYPNKTTLKTIESAKKGKNIFEVQDLKAFKKKLGL